MRSAGTRLIAKPASNQISIVFENSSFRNGKMPSCAGPIDFIGTMICSPPFIVGWVKSNFGVRSAVIEMPPIATSALFCATASNSAAASSNST